MKKINTDWLRFIVSCLIVGVHTQALRFISNDCDYLFSQVLSRVYVPLFLMITGYFTIGRCLRDQKKLISSVKKLLYLYIFSIIIYLPLIIKSGYFNDFSLRSFLCDFLFNGMYFHLWYFPATIIGILLISFLIDTLGEKKTLLVCSILYIIGSLGDSYYGLLTGPIKNIYDYSFNISLFTRNGVFYAPLFLAFGYRISKYGKKKRKDRDLLMALGSYALMIVEALILHHYEIPRHTTMPIFLIPTAYYAFKYIMSGPITSNVKARQMSTWIYILHPVVYTFLRVFGNVTHLTLLYEQSFLYFSLTLVLSIISAYVFVKCEEKTREYIHKKDLKNS